MPAKRGYRRAVRARRLQPVDQGEVDLRLFPAPVGKVVADQILHVGMDDGQVQPPAKPCYGRGEALVVDHRRSHANPADQTDMKAAGRRHHRMLWLAALSGSSSSKQRW